MITRQHHCRACGLIFCWQCAPHRSISHEQLPYARFEEVEQKMHSVHSHQLTRQPCYSVKSARAKAQRRVCDACTMRIETASSDAVPQEADDLIGMHRHAVPAGSPDAGSRLFPSPESALAPTSADLVSPVRRGLQALIGSDDKSSPTAGLTVSPAEPEQQEETPAAQRLQGACPSSRVSPPSEHKVDASKDSGTVLDPCEESFDRDSAVSSARGGDGPSRSLLRLLIYTLGLAIASLLVVRYAVSNPAAALPTLVLSDVIPTILHEHSGRAAGGDEDGVLVVGRVGEGGGGARRKGAAALRKILQKIWGSPNHFRRPGDAEL